MQDRPMHFNVTGYKKFVDTVSDSLKTNIHNFFPVTYLCEAGFYSYISVQTTYCTKLNIETDMTI